MARQQKLIHLHGSTQLTKAKAEAVGMVAGELAVMNGTTETSELYVLTSGGDIATFVTGAKVAGDIATAKTGAETTAKGYAEQALADAKAYTNTREEVLQGEIDDAEDRIKTLEDKFTGESSVAAQIEAAVAAEKKAREDEDAEIRKEFAAADTTTLNSAKADATTKANEAEANAKAYADGLAKNYDAVGSAANALADAKDYADGLINGEGGVDSRLDALETDSHTHANKALLDTYDQTNADIKDAVTKKHEHANKAELDKIADGDKAKWDAATNRINTFMDSEEIAGTVDTLHEINNWMQGEGVNATELTNAIAAEKKAREDEDAEIRGEFAAADTALKTELQGYADQAEADALAAAKAYADGLAKDYDAAGSAAAAETAAKTYADGLNTAMDTRVDALEAKFGTGEGSVSDQIAGAIATEAARSNKYTDDAITAEVTRSNGYADQAEADAITAAKTYTNERETAITTAFTTAINNAIAAIDLENKGTGTNTGLDVTVKIENGKTMTVTVDDSNLIIDCGTY